MKKKSYNRNYEYFKSNQVGMIKRLIETYLQNEKIASLSRSELEQQRNVIFSFLKQMGIYELNDKKIFFDIMSGKYDEHLNMISQKHKKEREFVSKKVSPKKASITHIKRELRFQKLELLWQQYEEQQVSFGLLFQAFCEYFEDRLDIYSNQITQQEVCTYTERYLTRRKGLFHD
ncbi:MAG: hypothetical protein HFH86_04265 [Bacilli bacterium]|jgi:hypothetical protein|nr:hypothetical protein [Bacilli bacterium]